MLTIDLDSPPVPEIVYSWGYAKWYGGDGPYGRVSSGRNGVHIKSNWTVPPDPGVERFHRERAGDDTFRIRGDISNVFQVNQVLFDRKGDRESGPWTPDLNTLIKSYNYAKETRTKGKPFEQNEV